MLFYKRVILIFFTVSSLVFNLPLESFAADTNQQEYDFVEYIMTHNGSYEITFVTDPAGHTWYTKNIIREFTFQGYDVFASDYYESWDAGKTYSFVSSDDVQSYDDVYLYMHGNNIGIPSKEEIYDPPFKIKRKFKIGDTLLVVADTKIEAIGFEDITVPAGYFPNCLMIKSTSSSRTSREWYAKGIGIVYQEKDKVDEVGINVYKMMEYSIVSPDTPDPEVGHSVLMPIISLLLQGKEQCGDGGSYLDGCGICVAGNTGKQPCVQQVGTVTSAGQIWMDRNLGASRVAISSTDAAAYGDLYQWGRGTDGHEKRTSPTTSTLSSSDLPGHGRFILAPDSPWNWRTPSNENLWQGVSGTNNPCPSGFRLPTRIELETERGSWSSSNSAGAFDSPLKLVLAGKRSNSNGNLDEGIDGHYWSSTVHYNKYSSILTFYSIYAGMSSYGHRTKGFSVRCIKDTSEPVCDSSHINLCTSTGTCSSVGGYWYNTACISIPEPAV